MMEHPLPTNDEEVADCLDWICASEPDMGDMLHLLYQIKRKQGMSVLDALHHTLETAAGVSQSTVDVGAQ